MRACLRILASLFAFCLAADAQSTECAQVTTTGDEATLVADSIDPPLGNRMVTFERRFNVPRQLSPEFLLVDLVSDLGDLAEDRDAVLCRVSERVKEMDPRKLSRAVSLYGKYSTQKKIQEMLHHVARVGI